MKNNSIFYTPGQVASFYSVKKDTLLFYDRIGLFSPSLRKENGYRYYSADQLSELDTILTLRDLDFSIPDIKDAIADLNTPSFISLLEKEEESIRKKISSYKALLNVVNTIKSSMKEACEAEKGKLYTAFFKAQPVIKVPIRDEGKDTTSDEAWEDAYRKLISVADGKALINFGSIVRIDEARKHLGAICREVYATYGKASSSVIEEGRYAYMFFKGPISGLSSFYEQFFTAADEENLHLMGDIYEELTISSIATKNENEHVTKLMVRIE